MVLLREARGAPELLLLRRHARSGFAASAWVFPGGVADPADRLLPAGNRSGPEPAALAARTGREPQVALGLAVAAVRETFEEAGVLLARHRDGAPIDLDDPEVVAMRRALGDRDAQADFGAWVRAADLVLDLGALAPLSRWLTPASEPRRYDTLFFLARAPQGQVAAHDDMETTGSRWTTAAGALAAAQRGELTMIYPTLRTLETLATADDLDAALASAPTTPLRPLRPRMVTGPGGTVQVEVDG